MTRYKSARDAVADYFSGSVVSFRSSLAGVGRAALLAAVVGAVAPIAAPTAADAASARGARQHQAPRADAHLGRRRASAPEVRMLDEVLIDPDTLPVVPPQEAEVEPIVPEFNATFQKARRDLFALERRNDAAGLPSGYLLALHEVGRQMALAIPEGVRERRANLFRYSEHEWSESIARFGVAAGFAPYGTADARGRFSPSAELLPTFLAGRDNASVAGAVAAAATIANNQDFMRRMGRPPAMGEMMLSHYVGVEATVKLAKAAQAGSRLQASTLVPKAAQAHPALFAGGMLPLTAHEVLGVAEKLMQDYKVQARDALVRFSADAQDTMDSHIPMRPTA